MREIRLTNRNTATQVDDDIFLAVGHLKWFAGTWGYVQHSFWDNGVVRSVSLHSLVMGDAPGLQIDHIDGNPLNNTRANLRHVTAAGNARNRRPKQGRRYRGITRLKYGKWQVVVRGRYVGVFETQEEAARAFDAAARVTYGDGIVWLNFPNEKGVVR